MCFTGVENSATANTPLMVSELPLSINIGVVTSWAHWIKKSSATLSAIPFVFIPFVGAVVASAVSTFANAVPILSGLPPISPATIASCTLHEGRGDEIENGSGRNCQSTALTPTLADWNSNYIVGNFDGTAPTTQTLQTALDNWNVAQGANFGGMWALKNGGNLDVNFHVTDTAVADATRGGLNFRIDVAMNPGYNRATDPTLQQLVWTQALYNSFDKTRTDLDPALNTLDTYFLNFTATCLSTQPNPVPKNNTAPANFAPNIYCDPIYPFRNGDAHFEDMPRAFWPDESFRAIALLSTVTFVTNAAGMITERDLTVYNGVNWGFDLSAEEPLHSGMPEPATILLLVPPLTLLGLVRRKAIARKDGRKWGQLSLTPFS